MSQVSYGTITIVDTTDIARIYMVYAKSVSNTTPPSDELTWSESIASAPGEGDFIWQKTVVEKAITEEKTYSDPVCVTGSSGQGVEKIINYYCNYGQGQPEEDYSGWQLEIPEYDGNKPNYWTKVVVIYSDDTREDFQASGAIATFESEKVGILDSLEVTLNPKQSGSGTPWIGTDHDNTPYLRRAMPTQSNDYNRETDMLVGGTVAWNQLASASATSVTVQSGHKYVAKIGGAWSVAASSGSTISVTGGTDMLIDLTAMFGSTIADYIYSLEQATAGAGVAWFRRYFPEDYYPYSANTLQSVQATAHKTYDGGGNVIGNYALDSSLTLRGIPKLGASNNLYYDGDTYESDGTVTRKYGIVDLGSLNYTDNGAITGGRQFYTTINEKKKGTTNIMSSNFVAVALSETIGEMSGRDTNRIVSFNTTIRTATAFKSAMSGVYLVYELATPTTETADPYTNPQTVDPDGTEEYVTANNVPVGHDSTYSLVCPISGWDEVETVVCGKNLCDISDGETTTTQANLGSVVVPSGTYTASAFLKRNDGGASRIYIRVGDGAWEGGSSVSGTSGGTSTYTFSVTEPTAVFFGVQFLSNYNTMYYSQFQLEVGSTATAYEPYQGHTYTTDLPQTVYGGTLDVVSGVLTVDRAMVDMGTLNWGYSSTTQKFATAMAAKKVRYSADVGSKNVWCSALETVGAISSVGVTVPDCVIFELAQISGSNVVCATNSAYTDVASFKTAMTGQTMVYFLATPTTIQCDPQTVQTLIGDNNVWGDGTVEVRGHTISKRDVMIYKDNGLTDVVNKSAEANTNAAEALEKANDGIVSTTQLWYQTNSTSAPRVPTSHNQVDQGTVTYNNWRSARPNNSVDSYKYYYYCYEYLHGDGTYTYSAEAILDTSNLSQYQIDQLQVRIKKMWSNSTGSYMASGIKIGTETREVDINDSSTYGFNSKSTTTGVSFNYNTIPLTSLGTDGIKLYSPTLTNGVITGSRLDATLNTNGLILNKGGIKAREGYSDFIYLSTDPYGNYSINGSTGISDWKQIIGTKFGVTADGTLHASNARISGNLTATDGFTVAQNNKTLTSITTNGMIVYDGVGSTNSNIVAKFTSDGAQIGSIDKSYISFSDRYLRLYGQNYNITTSETIPYVNFSDLRTSSDNTATIVEQFVGDGSTKRYRLRMYIYSERAIVTVDDVVTTVTFSSSITDTIEFTSAPNKGAIIIVTYETSDNTAKAFTLGYRLEDSNVGGMSTVIGYKNEASAVHSFASGYYTTASAIYAHAEGDATKATACAAHAEGSSTKATGDNSHAEGVLTEATGDSAHAEGQLTKAIGDCAHSEGRSTVARGVGSHAEGTGTVAGGGGYYGYSHAQNEGTIAAMDAQTVIGTYNIEDEETDGYEGSMHPIKEALAGTFGNNYGKYAFIIGNGWSDHRSNALTVDWFGNVQSYSQIADSSKTSYDTYDYSHNYAIIDKTGDTIGAVGNHIYANGAIGSFLTAGRTISGTKKLNSISVNIDNSGNCFYGITDPRAFCSALDLGETLRHEPAAITCATGKYMQLAYITVTPGTWLLMGSGQFPYVNTTGIRRIYMSTATSGYNNVTAGPASLAMQLYNNAAPISGNIPTYVNSGPMPITFTSNTIVRLIGCQNSGSNISVTGRIYAVRLA